MKTFTLKVFESGQEYLEMIDENGQVWGVPMDESNSDYIAYLAWKESN